MGIIFGKLVIHTILLHQKLTINEKTNYPYLMFRSVFRFL